MTIHYRFALSLCGTMLIALATGGTTAQAANSFELIIADGPHAGSYSLPAANIACMNVKARKQFSAAYKDTNAKDAKIVSGIGINVFSSDDLSSRRGEINVRFGDPEEKRPATYETPVSRDSKGFTFTRKGAVIEVGFEGRAQSGTKLRLTAHCTDIDEF